MLTTIAWNGIRVSVPSTWELGRIEARHLFFHHRDAPAMEIKWEPVKGRFSHRSHLKKLMARQKRHPGRHLEAWHLPQHLGKGPFKLYRPWILMAVRR